MAPVNGTHAPGFVATTGSAPRLAALLSFSILIEWRASERGRQKSVTPLSGVITSFHPIERHGGHRLGGDPDSVGQAGQRGPQRAGVRGGRGGGG